ncbi:hypothetical protein K488DRAFT_47428 [Vararia minispora EC-137]|uniref:Uncharacterized protein n=1 Tax=Vararia minispora EC-137 TaxID=1314806 RepID=A0ACB8QPL8_9AGAM|nr:hypothetical protein K488DRAFT_47428 [Vararia minispora EC-137]
MSYLTYDLTACDIRAIALKTITLFEKRGLSSCLVGSAATILWGVPRVPNDIDLVVMTTAHAQEGLKRLLAADDSDFELRPSRNPRNTYKVVWCKVPGSSYKKCKVDILVPGIMNIPLIHTSRLLQAWDDHRSASLRRPDLREKQYVDAEDINILLSIARRRGMHRRDGVGYLPSSFLSAADVRVRSYVLSYPQSMTAWKAVGFTKERGRV